MKNLFALLFCAFALAFTAQAQTLTIGPASVEVITSGAKTRAFYPLDATVITVLTPVVTVKDAVSGSILFTGDTSLVTITGVTLWASKLTKLRAWMQEATTTGGTRYFIPKRGVQYLYRLSNTSISAIYARGNNLLVTTALDSLKITGVTGVSNKLAHLRSKMLMDQSRDALDVGETPTVAAGAAAGSSPTIAISGGPLCGKVTLTTGSSPTTTGILFTVTLPVTYPNACIPVVTAADSDSGSQAARWYADSAAGNTFTLNASGTALTAATQYVWFYRVGGN